MLCFLQAVLGFDNLLYISIESQRAPVAYQRAVRFWGIILALALRFFGHEVVPMSKTTFYFPVVVLVAVEAVQSGYSRKLNAERRAVAARR
ncbi:MAG: hypothetical protein U5K36_06755 [Roseovarius sp.]|nr:hypothetical protein [Roseovarius sp.]